MSIHIIVTDNNIELALHQLQQKQYFLQATRWYKKRQGFYEQAAILKRKKRKMKRLISQAQSHFALCTPPTPHPNFWHKIDLKQQHQRTGNTFAVGR